MHQPGIEQRPLQMISGVTKEFGQVSFDGATVPADQMVGAPGEGWPLAMTVVGHEREPSTLGFAARYGKTRRDSCQRASTVPVPEELAWAAVETEMLTHHVQRRLSEQLDGISHGSDGSHRQAADDLGRAVRRSRRAGGRRYPRPGPARRLPVQPRAERHGRHIADPEEHHRRTHPGIGSLTCTTCQTKSTSRPTAPLRIITLNRPDELNAVNDNLHVGLAKIWDATQRGRRRAGGGDHRCGPGVLGRR